MASTASLRPPIKYTFQIGPRAFQMSSSDDQAYQFHQNNVSPSHESQHNPLNSSWIHISTIGTYIYISLSFPWHQPAARKSSKHLVLIHQFHHLAHICQDALLPLHTMCEHICPFRLTPTLRKKELQIFLQAHISISFPRHTLCKNERQTPFANTSSVLFPRHHLLPGPSTHIP